MTWLLLLWLAAGAATNAWCVVDWQRHDPEWGEAHWSDFVLVLNLVTALLWPFLAYDLVIDHRARRRP